MDPADEIRVRWLEQRIEYLLQKLREAEARQVAINQGLYQARSQ